LEIKTNNHFESFEAEEYELVSCNVYNMQTELQVSLYSELHLHPTNISVQDGDPDVTSSTANHVPPKKPGMLLFIYIFFYFLIGALDCATLGCRKLHI
jgi:hypothetical protein